MRRLATQRAMTIPAITCATLSRQPIREAPNNAWNTLQFGWGFLRKSF